MVEVRQSNPKAFETLNAHLEALQGVESRVGWFESAKYENGTQVAYIAAIQELGSGPIPPRPFMRPTAIEQKEKWSNTAAVVARRVLAGKMTAMDAMDALGLQAEGDILKKIASITTPPLSPITLLARKRRMEGGTVTGKTIGRFARKVFENDVGDLSGVSTKPLNDTGHMIATLTHVTTTAPTGAM